MDHSVEIVEHIEDEAIERSRLKKHRRRIRHRLNRQLRQWWNWLTGGF